MASCKTFVIAVLALCVAAAQAAELPVFFFHGVTADASYGDSMKANLTAEGRVFNALTFCQSACSAEALQVQIPLAIAQVREIIANDSETYANGYIFIGHSQGGNIARAVIEEMDDHNVTTFISLAGAQNGGFYGPQAADYIPLYLFINYYASSMLPATIFNFSEYTEADWRGNLQYAVEELYANTPELSDELSGASLSRSPDNAAWLEWNPYLPVINNVNICNDTDCEDAKARRKANFIRLQDSHFFISPRDGVIAPYQGSHFGQYNDVSEAIEIKTKFEDFEIINMENTTEYLNDTYGLQTLHTSGRLHLHLAEAVSHECWVKDTYFYDNISENCYFADTFDKYIYEHLF